MSENPYEAPQASSIPAPGVGERSESRDDVRRVAVYQKGVLFCILIYLSAYIGLFLVPPEAAIVPGLILVGVALTSIVFVFLLAMKIYNPVMGIILGIGIIIPVIGLIILLMVSSKATKILRDNGIQVGLLGADLSKI